MKKDLATILLGGALLFSGPLFSQKRDAHYDVYLNKLLSVKIGEINESSDTSNYDLGFLGTISFERNKDAYVETVHSKRGVEKYFYDLKDSVEFKDIDFKEKRWEYSEFKESRSQAFSNLENSYSKENSLGVDWLRSFEGEKIKDKINFMLFSKEHEMTKVDSCMDSGEVVVKYKISDDALYLPNKKTLTGPAEARFRLVDLKYELVSLKIPFVDKTFVGKVRGVLEMRKRE